jgi:hypothetical protein
MGNLRRVTACPPIQPFWTCGYQPRLFRRMSKPMHRTAKKQRVLDFAAAHGWISIGESEWNELRQALPDVSVNVIQNAGLPVAAPWRGVRQHTFEELEDSLRAFSAVYQERADLRPQCRAQVITAKDRAKWLSKRSGIDEETRERKATMAEWMLVWLGDPSLFPAWVTALKAASRPSPT